MTGACSGSRRRLGARELAHIILCAGALLLSAAPTAWAQFTSFCAAVNSSADLTTLKAVINAAGLAEALSEPTLPYTVFAPSNDAFAEALQALQISEEELLSQPQDTLRSLILYHAVPTPLYAASVREADTAVLTVAGPANSGPLTVRRNGTAVTVAARGSTARVTTADLVAGAGVVHVVDAVLLPFYTTLLEAVTSNPELPFLATLLKSFNLYVEVLADPTLTYTLLAPSDPAFARTLDYLGMSPDTLLTNADVAVPVLFGHLLDGLYLAGDFPTEPTSVETYDLKLLTAQRASGRVTVWSKYMNTTVVEADIPVGLGPKSVVHVVDQALLPYYRTVLDITAAEGDLNTFVQAVVAEGTYTSVATGEAPFSGAIFAPNDDAFRSLLAALGLTADELLADKDTLRRVLETHIVPGEPLTYGSKSTSLTTINGQALTAPDGLEVAGEYPTIASPGSAASVLTQESTPRISVFVIDTVLLPGSSGPSYPPPPGYGGYGAYGGYGPYGSVPPPYGGYGSFGRN